MDISTLLTSQSAPAQGALSIGGGQLGGSRVNGAEGEDAVDRFNQLLSNFLTVTGENGLALEGEAGVEGAALNGLTLTGTAAGTTGTGVTIAVPQGLRGLALAAGNGKAGATDGRWTQAGLNLLAAGGLQGQELNEDVVAFLNDLSAAIGNKDGLASADTQAALAAPAEEDAKGGIADALSLMQGEGAVPTLTPAVSPTNTVTISVIPQLQANAAPSALGVPMPADGTGAALDSVPQGDARSATPATIAKVIPKLDKFADAPATATMNTGIVGPQVAGAIEAPVTGNDPLLPAAEPVAAPVATAVTADTAGTQVGAAAATTTAPAPSSQAQAMTAPPVDTPQPQGAIALPEGMQAAREPVKVAVPKLADMATSTPVQQNSAPDGQAARQAADGQADASAIDLAPAASQKSPAAKAGSAAPEPATPALTASTTPASAPTAATAAAADPAAAGVVLPMTAKPTPEKAASPAPAVTKTAAMATAAPSTEPTPSTGDQVEPAVTITADDATAQAAVAAKTTVTTAHASTGRAEKSAAKVASATISAPATTTEASATADPELAANPSTDEQTEAKGSERKAAAAPKAAVAAKDQPADDSVAASDVPVAEPSTNTDKVEDESVTNRRMLAPKHVKEGEDGQARTELAGAAQTAGQNTTGTRPDPTPVAALTAAARGDSLLTRAVSASTKVEGSGSSTDAAALTSTDSTGAEQAALAMATADGSKPGATDFAQSLRQATSPHRPTAYTPPAMQVAVQVQQAAEDGNDRVSIQLTPHDLGKIEVQLEFGAGGKLRAKVMAENPQTLEMLQKDAKGLEKALQDAGLNTDANSLSFSLQQDNGDQAQQRQQGQDGSNYGTALASEDAEEEDPAIIAQAQIMELGRVDVRV